MGRVLSASGTLLKLVKHLGQKKVDITMDADIRPIVGLVNSAGSMSTRILVAKRANDFQL